MLPKGDGTIRRVVQWMYNLEEIPSSEELSKRFANWTEYATIVSAFLWKSIALGLTQRPFNEVILKREGAELL